MLLDPIEIDWTDATENLYTTGSGRFDGGLGVGVDPNVQSLLNITSNHADRTAIRIDNTGTGNPVVQFALSNTVLFVMGIDDSDSDKFKISSGTTLGAPTLVIDSGINLSGIGTITTSGAINTLHIVPGTGAGPSGWDDYVFLSGDGTEDGGLSIAIPYTAGNNFFYGIGGMEHHFFGQSGNLEITDDGNIIAASYNAITLAVDDLVIDDAANNNSLTVSGDQTIDQDVSNGASPTFNALTVTTMNTYTFDQSVASGANVTFGDIAVPTINDNTDQDLDLWKNLVVGDRAEGKALYVHRNAEEFVGYLKMFVDQDDKTQMESTGNFEVTAGGAFRFEGTDEIFFITGGGGNINLVFGGMLYFQDRDDSSSGRATLDSSNGWLALGTGDAPTVALDVNGAALISTTLGVTGIATFSDDVLIDSDTASLQLGDDQDIELYSDTPGELSLKKAADSDIKIVFEADNEGSIQWMEDALQFDFDGHIQIQKDSGTAPFIKVNSALNTNGSEVYVETNVDSGSAGSGPVRTRLESLKDSFGNYLGQIGTFTAHDLDIVTNGFNRMTVSAAGYVRVINRLMVGADAAPDYPLEVTGISRLGDGGATNYTQFAADGTRTMAGTARIGWTKITANGVAIRNAHGTTASSVSDLRTAHDNNFYILSEESGETPGMDIEVDFTGVTAFNWVQILARYEKAIGSHGITVMLEITPFNGSAWHRYDYFSDQGADLTNESHSFFVPDDSAYINSGVVKVRFVHEMTGTSSNHDLVIDVCALYQ
jgi:hypothetical protein